MCVFVFVYVSSICVFVVHVFVWCVSYECSLLFDFRL